MNLDNMIGLTISATHVDEKVRGIVLGYYREVDDPLSKGVHILVKEEGGELCALSVRRWDFKVEGDLADEC